MYIEQHSRYQNKANNIQLRYDDKDNGANLLI